MPDGGEELDSGRISDLLDSFEDQWRSGKRPDLLEFIALSASVGSTSRAHRQLAFDLVMIDLEYRWQIAPSQADEEEGPKTSSQGTGDATGPWPARPMLEDYVARLPLLGEVSSLPLDVIGEEYRVRVAAGDATDVSQYQQRFPHVAEQLDRALRDAIDTPLPVTVKIYHERKRVFRTELKGCLEIGRQLPGEPPPYALIDTDKGQRLVIAAITERYLSRRHLSVELCDDGRIKVANLSRKNPIILPDHQSTVSPGESAVHRIPLVLMVEQKAIRLIHE